MRKKLLALGLAIVMALLVCGCGASDSGDERNAGQGGAVQSEGAGGSATQGGAGQSVAKEDSADYADVMDDRGRVLWGNVADDDTVTIYLKDEAVNRMEEDEDGEVINAIEVEFFSDDGTVVLRCTLTVNGTEANYFDGDSVASSGAEAKDEYVNDVVYWKVQSAGIAAILKDCDSVSAVFRDYQGGKRQKDI